MVKLLHIRPSPIQTKKYRATFDDGTHTDFGAHGYSDFTIHHSEKRRELYNIRHKRRENWNDFKSAGALAKWILWNKPSFNESVADYKKKFNI